MKIKKLGNFCQFFGLWEKSIWVLFFLNIAKICQKVVLKDTWLFDTGKGNISEKMEDVVVVFSETTLYIRNGGLNGLNWLTQLCEILWFRLVCLCVCLGVTRDLRNTIRMIVLKFWGMLGDKNLRITQQTLFLKNNCLLENRSSVLTSSCILVDNWLQRFC